MTKLVAMESPCPSCGGSRVAGWKGNPVRWRCRVCNMQGWVRRGEK